MKTICNSQVQVSHSLPLPHANYSQPLAMLPMKSSNNFKVGDRVRCGDASVERDAYSRHETYAKSRAPKVGHKAPAVDFLLHCTNLVQFLHSKSCTTFIAQLLSLASPMQCLPFFPLALAQKSKPLRALST